MAAPHRAPSKWQLREKQVCGTHLIFFLPTSFLPLPFLSMSLLQLHFCSFLSFPFLPDITVLRLLHRLDVSRIVLAIRPGHHHLCAQDGPLGQSLAGRHGGVHPLANCHEDFMDVRFLLSLTEFARPVAFSSASVKSRRRRSDANDTHTLTVSHTHTHTHRTVSMSPPEIRYGGAGHGFNEPNKEVRCQPLPSPHDGTARRGGEARAVFYCPDCRGGRQSSTFPFT